MRLSKKERLRQPAEAMRMGMRLQYAEDQKVLANAKGAFTLEMRDEATGALLASWAGPNIITKDAGILAARLFANSQSPTPDQHNGPTMLALGVGATGALLAPDAPQSTQRRINEEISRKPFGSVTFRDALGNAVSYPTNVVDFTTSFGGPDAVGPLNEMGLLATYSGSTFNPIDNGPSDYDPSINVNGKDILMNYFTFPVMSKPLGAVLTIGYRITF